MIINNEFQVGVPIEQTWDTLTDLERIAPCMPGALPASTGITATTAETAVAITAAGLYPLVYQYVPLSSSVNMSSTTTFCLWIR